MELAIFLCMKVLTEIFDSLYEHSTGTLRDLLHKILETATEEGQFSHKASGRS